MCSMMGKGGASSRMLRALPGHSALLSKRNGTTRASTGTCVQTRTPAVLHTRLRVLPGRAGARGVVVRLLPRHLVHLLVLGLSLRVAGRERRQVWHGCAMADTLGSRSAMRMRAMQG